MLIVIGIVVVALMLISGQKPPEPEFCKLHKWELNALNGKTYCRVCGFVIGKNDE